MEKLKVDTHHYFEIMDRCSILLSNLDSFLIQNPATKAEPTIAEKLDQIGELLAEVYQEAGSIYYRESSKSQLKKIEEDDK
jgi:hypothetical protein